MNMQYVCLSMCMESGSSWLKSVEPLIQRRLLMSRAAAIYAPRRRETRRRNKRRETDRTSHK